MILGVLMLFSSCSTYYYSTLSSSEGVAEKDDFGDFVYENDSVKVVYSFFGYNLPIHITVINNSDQPLTRNSIELTKLAPAAIAAAFTPSSRSALSLIGTSIAFLRIGVFHDTSP